MIRSGSEHLLRRRMIELTSSTPSFPTASFHSSEFLPTLALKIALKNYLIFLKDR